MVDFITISGESVGYYEEKRSKFYATLRHTETEDEAFKFIEEMRSKYWDARHNCYAICVDGGRLVRFSDDSEPHGTAGKPILEVIEGNKLKNVTCVVTRYFGGVLLGTGGLVKAYSSAAKDAVEKALLVEMIPCTMLSIPCEYQDHQKLLYLIEGQKGVVTDTEFSDKVILSVKFRDSDLEEFLLKLTENFSARIEATVTENKLLPFEIEKN